MTVHLAGGGGASWRRYTPHCISTPWSPSGGCHVCTALARVHASTLAAHMLWHSTLPSRSSTASALRRRAAAAHQPSAVSTGAASLTHTVEVVMGARVAAGGPMPAQRWEAN